MINDASGNSSSRYVWTVSVPRDLCRDILKTEDTTRGTLRTAVRFVNSRNRSKCLISRQ